jgi:hypothetical protein
MTMTTGMTSMTELTSKNAPMTASMNVSSAGPVTDFRSTVRGGAPSARYVVSP